MKLIPLTRGLIAKVDDADYPALSKYRWCADHKGYAMRRKGDKQVYMHKEILGASEHVQVDHINQDKRDNQRANLRTASKGQNAMNRGVQSNNKTGFKGIARSRNGRWTAQIKMKGKQIYLGTFDLPRDAALAYNQAARDLYGEFASLNPTDD